MSAVTPEPTCAGSKFRCNSGMCIDIQSVCNQNSDCDDESDEQHCSELVVSPVHRFCDVVVVYITFCYWLKPR